MLKHDAPLKRLYQIKRVAISLVRDFHAAMGLEPELMQDLDLPRMKLGSTEFVDNKNIKRICDLVWEIPSLGLLVPFVLYLLIEFQSTFDRNMVRRLVRYASLLEDQKEQNRKAGEPEVRIRTVTFFTGRERWRGSLIVEPPPEHHSIMTPRYHYGRVLDARRHPLHRLNPNSPAVVEMRLERAGTVEEVLSILQEVFRLYKEDHIRSAFHGRAADMEWLTRADGSRISYKQLLMEYEGGTMAQAEMTRFDEFFEEHRIEAISEGVAIGRSEGRSEGQREIMHRTAARFFGGKAAERFTECLRSIDDPVRLNEVHDAMFECTSVEELLALVD